MFNIIIIAAILSALFGATEVTAATETVEPVSVISEVVVSEESITSYVG